MTSGSPSTVAELTDAVQRVYGAAAWLVHHAAGHALYESGVIPATLDVETAADAFATVLVVESRRGLAAAVAAVREA